MKHTKKKLALHVSTIRHLEDLTAVRGGTDMEEAANGSMCQTFCRPDCKPSPYSRPGDWCV
jgi:hypothetical protein